MGEESDEQSIKDIPVSNISREQSSPDFTE